MERNGHCVTEIVHRVLRHLLGEGDEREREEFHRLIHEPGLLNNASDLENREKIMEQLNTPSSFSSGEAYERFISYCRKRERMRWIRFARVAAVLVLPVLLGVGAWWLLSREKDSAALLSQVEEVSPVSPKAYLTLETGQHVALGQQGQTTMQDGSVMRQDSAVVSYAGLEKADKSKVVFHELNVPRGGEYLLVLSDSTRVWVNADSRLRYPVRFEGKREVYLLAGEAYFDVARDEALPFVVHTSRGQVKVLGTEFNVNTYDKEAGVVTTLVEGSVQFAAPGKAVKSVVLKPGDQLLTGEGNDWQVREVNVAEYVAWKDGEYVFNHQTLENLMKIVERNYDVTVFFASEECKSLRFSGDLKKYDKVEKFLQFIETGGDVRFVIKDRTITVYKK